MIADPKADAVLGMLAGIAFDMFSPGNLAPSPDARIAAAGYVIRGHITALDAILPPIGPLQLGEKTWYGFLAESIEKPGEFVVAIRGTADAAEWAINAKFTSTPHHAGGRVEIGFNGLYQSMRYRAIGSDIDGPMVPEIVAAIGGGSISLIGHSLGAALAELATLDLATLHGLEMRVRGRYFCSPRLGDESFAEVFEAVVKDAVGYILPGDVVPMVPAGFGYVPLHCTIVVGPNIAQAIIKDSWLCFHHIWCVLSAMDFELMNWQSAPPVDRDLTACILGPRKVPAA